MNKDILMYANGAGVGKSGLEVAVMDQERERGITIVGHGICYGKSYVPRVKEVLNILGLDEDVSVVDLKKHLVSMGMYFDEPYPLVIADDYFSDLPEYFEGSLIVPASNKTKGNHAYPWYHGGKW